MKRINDPAPQRPSQPVSDDIAGPGDGVYRDPGLGAQARRKLLVQAYLGRLATLPPQLTQMYASRWRRIGFGIVALLGSVCLFGTGTYSIFAGELWEPGALAEGTLTAILFASWAAALLAALIAGPLARWHFRRRLVACVYPSPNQDVFAYNAQLEERRPSAIAASLMDRLETASLGLPLAGLMMLLPLTLHFGAFALLMGGYEDPNVFDVWIHLSTFVVGHCHIYMAWRAWRFARTVRRSPCDLRHGKRLGYGSLGRVTALSALPGVLFLLIPTIVVAITGFCFIGIAFSALESWVVGERVEVYAIAAADTDAIAAG